MTMHERGMGKLPPEALETIRDILHGDDSDKLVRAFEYATGWAFRCTEVIEATPTKLVCMAECMGGKVNSLPDRAEMHFDLVAGEVKGIELVRMDRPRNPTPTDRARRVRRVAWALENIEVELRTRYITELVQMVRDESSHHDLPAELLNATAAAELTEDLAPLIAYLRNWADVLKEANNLPDDSGEWLELDEGDTTP
jgi:hypothetical protein